MQDRRLYMEDKTLNRHKNISRIGFFMAVKICLFEKYLNFSGRASRAEYWYFRLFVLCVGLLMLSMQLLTGLHHFFNSVNFLINIIFFIPDINVTTRRLHDINKSGLLQLLIWIPFAFLFLPLVFYGNFVKPYIGFTVSIFMTIMLMFIIGVIIYLIILLTRKGTIGDNRFGPNPLMPDESTADM